MNQNTWVVIVNFKAGSRRVEKKWPEIEESLKVSGLSYEILFTKHRFHAVELTVQSIRQGYRKFVSVGGDGTISEIVDGFNIQKVVEIKDLCVSSIPVGTGNDWVRMHNKKYSFKSAINLLKSAPVHYQDIGFFKLLDHKVVLDRTMVNIAGIGFDGDTCYYTNILKQKGKIAKNARGLYVKAGVKALFKRRSKHYRVLVDDKLFYEGRVFSCAFGIGKYSGGGIEQIPDAITDDGLVNITIIKRASILKLFYHFPKLFNSRIYDAYPLVVHTMGKHIHLDVISNGKSEIYENIEIDGEVFRASSLDLECLHKALKVIY